MMFKGDDKVAGMVVIGVVREGGWGWWRSGWGWGMAAQGDGLLRREMRGQNLQGLFISPKLATCSTIHQKTR